MLAAHERLALARHRRGDVSGAIIQYLTLADILRGKGRCLMALHVCYTALIDRPDDQIVWSATERAWRCVAARGRRELDAAHVEPGALVNATADFAQWQLSAFIRQSSLPGASSANAEAAIYLRQAILSEGNGRAGTAITFYEKGIATGVNEPAAFFALGLLYRLVDRRQDARAALQLAARHPLYRRAVALLD